MNKNLIGKMILSTTLIVCGLFLTFVFSSRKKADAQPPACTFSQQAGFPLTIEGQAAGTGICSYETSPYLLIYGGVACNGGEVACGQYSLWVEGWEQVDDVWICRGDFCIIAGAVQNCGGTSDYYSCYLISDNFTLTGNPWEFYAGILKGPCQAWNNNNILFVAGPANYDNGWY